MEDKKVICNGLEELEKFKAKLKFNLLKGDATKEEIITLKKLKEDFDKVLNNINSYVENMEQYLNLFVWITNRLSQINIYGNESNGWDKEQCFAEANTAFSIFNQEIEKMNIFKNETPVEIFKALRFNEWKNGDYLIPLYFLKLLPKGLELTTINGEKVIVGKDYVDNDIRFGCLAYTITPGNIVIHNLDNK